MKKEESATPMQVDQQESPSSMTKVRPSQRSHAPAPNHDAISDASGSEPVPPQAGHFTSFTRGAFAGLGAAMTTSPSPQVGHFTSFARGAFARLGPAMTASPSPPLFSCAPRLSYAG